MSKTNMAIPAKAVRSKTPCAGIGYHMDGVHEILRKKVRETRGGCYYLYGPVTPRRATLATSCVAKSGPQKELNAFTVGNPFLKTYY